MEFDFLPFSNSYASRVKLITNDAQKNAENKEIAKLRNVSMESKQLISTVWSLTRIDGRKYCMPLN